MKISDSNFSDIHSLARANLKTLLIAVTYKCNLNCIHCLVDANSKNKHIMTTGYLKKNIEQFSKIQTSSVVLFGGGEPFTRNDMVDLIEFTVNKGLLVNIDSNASLIDRNIIKRLKKIKKKIRLTISIDNLKVGGHNKFRGGNIFRNVMETIVRLRKEKIPVTINTVLNKNNLKEITKIIDYFVIKLGCRHSLIPIITSIGRGASKESKFLCLSNEKVLKFLKEVYFPKFRGIKKLGKSKYLDLMMPKAFIPDDIKLFPKCDFGNKMIGICVDGRVGICHYGNLCPELTIKRGDRHNLLNLWLNEELFKNLRSINENNLKGVCGNCKYASGCRGLCRLYAYKVYKDILAPYPVCQDLYHKELFPRKALLEKEKNCNYFINK